MYHKKNVKLKDSVFKTIPGVYLSCLGNIGGIFTQHNIEILDTNVQRFWVKRIMSKCQRFTSRLLTVVGVLWFPAVGRPEIWRLAGKQNEKRFSLSGESKK